MPRTAEATPGRAARWVCNAHWLLRALILALIGATMATGLAPFDRPAGLVIGLGVAFGLFIVPGTAARAIWMGWALGLGYFGLALRWIVNPFYVDAARDGWMAPFALPFLAGGLALFWGLGFGLARWLGGGALRQALALAVCWALADLARGHLFTGFPWAGFAQGLVETPLAQLAAWFGAEGLSFGLLLAVGLFAWVAARVSSLLYPAAIVALVGATALPRDPRPLPPADPAAPIVRLVQPNAPQDEKWDPAMAPVFYERLVTLTGRDPAADLVVWPETALPYLLEYAAPAFEEIADMARGAPVVLGMNRREGARYYNSLVVVGRGAEVLTTYDKAHLVPFGEYVPFGEWLERFGLVGMAASVGGGFTAGPGERLIDLLGIGKALPLICYEGIFPAALHSAERPRMLLLITNDAWFGPDAGPLQHLVQARLRAIEQGLPMVRVANTGVSAVIDGRGRIVDSLAMGQAGAIDVALPPALPPTLFSRTGGLPLWLLLAACGAALSATRPRIAVDPAAPRP